MKKVICIASAALLLIGCVKNEPSAPVEGGALISFDSPITAPNVKSVAYTSEFGESDSFNVWGYITANETESLNISNSYFAPGDEVNYESESTWATETDYDWPQNGYLSFVAYAPANAATAEVTDEGLQITDYTTDGTKDLLVSDVVYNQTKATNGGSVDMVFYHALSAIKFSVYTELVGMDVKLKTISLGGIKVTGSFNQGISESNTTMGLATANPCWTPSGEASSLNAYVNAEGLSITEEAQTLAEDGQVDLIVIPQNIQGEGVAILSVTYSIQNENMEEAVVQTVTAPLNVADAPANWYRGYCYTYNLQLHLDKITFTPSVDDWKEDGVDNVDAEGDITVRPTTGGN